MGKAATRAMIGRAAGGARRAAARPKHWWERLLLYPTAAGALLTAAPEWTDRGLAAWHNLKSGSMEYSERQQALLRKNITCLDQSPTVWHSNPSNVRVSATTCRSGDVLVRVSTPDDQGYFEWVELNRILGAGGSSLVPEARAATPGAAFGALRRAPGQSRDARLLNAAYQLPGVVCQRFLDQRRLLRHIRTPQGCFDEIIDTLNGAVVHRMQVACRGGC